MSRLQEVVDWAAEATIRGSISALCDLEALEKSRTEDARNAVATALTPAGEEMLAVSQALEYWLRSCPKGPIAIDAGHVRVAVKALAEGWNSALMRALATEPLTLTELSCLIPDVSYPALERRISWMRATGQLIALPREPRGIPYAPSDWLRRAVAPLCAAGRCERRHMGDVPPVTDVEVEAAFLLTLPLVRLSPAAEGRCLLASRTDSAAGEEDGPGLAGVAVEVRAGSITSMTIDIDDEPSNWAIGTSDLWLDAVLDAALENLRIGGRNPQLACDLVQGLHLSLLTER